MFTPSDRATTCTSFLQQAHSCKAQCGSDLCNSGDLVEAEHQCQTCEVKFDHIGNVISGKENCFTNTRDHLLDCPTGHNKCVNEMTASFSLTDGITYDFRRYCGNDEVEIVDGECEESYNFGDTDPTEYDVSKKCQTVCNSRNCNRDNDVEDLFQTYEDWGDGTTYPNRQYCREYSSNFDPDYVGNKPDGSYRICPIYANAGCFVSNHTTFGENQTGFHRGCSPFEFGDSNLKCNQWTDENGQKLVNTCKQQCTENYCNSQGELRDPVKCFNCREGFNHAGVKNEQDYFDDNCYNLNGNEHLIECPLYFDHCESNLVTDWFISGEQSYTIERRCSEKSFEVGEEVSCVQNQLAGNYYKDCYRQCHGDECNGANEIELEYSRLDENGNPVNLSCYEYTYDDLPDWWNPLNGSTSDLTNLNDKTRFCPAFANWGCFMGTIEPVSLPNVQVFHSQINKGCSIFDVDLEPECVNAYGASEVCKRQCTESYCNSGDFNTQLEEEQLLCHDCVEVFDHMGRRMDDDQNHNCYNLTDERYLKPCSGQCSTSLRFAR